MNPIGAGLLTAFGNVGLGVGNAFDVARKEALERDRLEQERSLRQQALDTQLKELAQRQSQFEATQAAASTPVGMLYKVLGIAPPAGVDLNERMPVNFADNAMKALATRDTLGREELQRARTSAFLEQAKGQPAQLLGQLGEGEDPEAAALIPRSAGVPRLGDEDLAAGLFSRGNKMSDIAALMKVLRPEAGEDAFAPLGENAPGLYNKRTGATTMFPSAPAGPAGQEKPLDRPGFQWVQSLDKAGKATWREDPIGSGQDLDAEARARGYGSFAQAPEAARMEMKRYMDNESLRRSKAQGSDAAGIKPPTQEQADQIYSKTATLGALRNIKGFSPEEITSFVGLLNKPAAQVQQVLAGIPQLGVKANERYAEFAATVGRLSKAMFEDAGKALTPMERSVTSLYTITGDEPNAAAFIQKVRYSEAIETAARDIKLDLARTGKGRIDLGEYDRRLQQAMAQAGIPTPTEHPGWSNKPGTSQQGGGQQGTRVRDPKTGRTGTVPPGQAIPPGVEVLR